jgi:hypothetical protein
VAASCRHRRDSYGVDHRSDERCGDKMSPLLPSLQAMLLGKDSQATAQANPNLSADS